jgi:hypothetical protein
MEIRPRLFPAQEEIGKTGLEPDAHEPLMGDQPWRNPSPSGYALQKESVPFTA